MVAFCQSVLLKRDDDDDDDDGKLFESFLKSKSHSKKTIIYFLAVLIFRLL